MLKITPSVLSTLSMSSLENSFQKLLARDDVGFLQLPEQKGPVTDSIQFAQKLADYDHLVVIAIGGSSMGPRALTELSGCKTISFLDNVDSLETENILSQIKDLSRTAWLMISKSGTTIEVLWNLDLISQIYESKNLNLWPQTFYITEETKNPLRDLAHKHVRPCLTIPLDVGGRFSVLSPVGLVFVNYLKMSSTDLLKGSQKALADKNEVLLAVAQYLSSFERKEDITLFWFYRSNMRWFGCWLQQLWAESLGKKIKIDGSPAPHFSAPMISIGTCDQHSILQQVLEGPKNKFVNVFRFKDVEKSQFTVRKTAYKETKLLEGLNYGDLIQAEAIATLQALNLSEVSTLSFEVEKMDSYHIGYLFMFFQLVVATLGEHTGINAFNQPSVNLSKKLALDFLQKLKS